MQQQINETLFSILSGSERKRLQLYESDKSFLHYKDLLEDDGFGTCEALCRILHEGASAQMSDINYREGKMMDIQNASKNYHKDFLKNNKDLTPPEL